MCIFCKEIDQDLILSETNYSFLIINKYPIGKFSLLVFPRRHIESMTEMTLEETKDIAELISFAAYEIKTQFIPDGINYFANEGKIAGQTINHFHFHIVPRFTGDGLKNFERNGEKKEIEKDLIEKIKLIF